MYRPSPLKLGDSRARRHTSPGPSSVRQVSKRGATNVLAVPGHGRVAVADHNRTLGVFCGTRTAVQLVAKLPWPMLEPWRPAAKAWVQVTVCSRKQKSWRLP
ncbi:hypothetical protein MCOR17_011246 [Pyricularia oryzae]|nr:hypothetical protein MCOR17_011246 [Pyricularia oryzae]